MRHRTAELPARLGYACRGAVYWLVGGLAILAAFGTGTATDSKGALEMLLDTPLGGVWLGLIGVGLLCFFAWRVLQSVFDADHLGRGWKAVVRRIAHGVSALLHLGLAGIAISLAFGLGAVRHGDGEGAARDWTASMLSVPPDAGLWPPPAFSLPARARVCLPGGVGNLCRSALT